MNKFLRFVCVVLALSLLAPGGGFISGASAQDSLQTPDYEAWQKVANQAEIALTQKRASSAALEGLRETLVDWRGQFLIAKDAGGARIKTLQNQIAALGTVGEGEPSETEEVAALRNLLAQELGELTAPRQVADEAYSRANGLIRETDNIIPSTRRRALV